MESLPAEEHVLDDVEVVAQGEVLVDDLDAEGGGVARAGDVAGPAVDGDGAAVDAVDPGDAFDQRRLAGAVVTDEGAHLAGVDGEIDLGEDFDGAEALGYAGEFEQHWVLVPYSVSPASSQSAA